MCLGWVTGLGHRPRLAMLQLQVPRFVAGNFSVTTRHQRVQDVSSLQQPHYLRIS